MKERYSTTHPLDLWSSPQTTLSFVLPLHLNTVHPRSSFNCLVIIFSTRVTFPTHLKETDWVKCALGIVVRWSHFVTNLHRLKIQFNSLFRRVLTQQPMANFKFSTNVQNVTNTHKLKENRKKCNIVHLTKKSGLRWQSYIIMKRKK